MNTSFITANLLLLAIIVLLQFSASFSTVVHAERPPIEYLLDNDTKPLTRKQLTNAINSFHTWFEEHYEGKLMVKLRPPSDKDEIEMGMGVESLSRFREGQPYLSIPLKMCVDANTLTTGPNSPSPLFKDFWPYLKSKKDAPSQHVQLLLATFLIYARWVAPGETFWDPYVKLLPRRIDTPEHAYTENDLHFLQYFPRYVDKIKQARKKREVEFYWMRDHVSKNPQFKKLLPKKIFTRPRWSWAMAVLSTRMIWWEGGPHLVPLLDMINCGVTAANKNFNVHETVREGDKAVTKAGYDIRKGDEIFENYGQSNAYYFVHHGFSMPFNPSDCYHVTLPKPERELTRKAFFLTGARIEDGDQLCTNLGDARKTRIIMDLARIYTLPDKVLEKAIARRQLPDKDTDRQTRRTIRWVGKRLKQKADDITRSELLFARREMETEDAPHWEIIERYINTMGIPLDKSLSDLRKRVKILTERIKKREAKWKREELEEQEKLKQNKQKDAGQEQQQQEGGDDDEEGGHADEREERVMESQDFGEDEAMLGNLYDKTTSSSDRNDDNNNKKFGMSNKKTNLKNEILNARRSAQQRGKKDNNNNLPPKIDDDF